MELNFFLENMLFCKSCKKEVIIYGVSYKEGIDEELDQFRNKIEEEGKLIQLPLMRNKIRRKI